MARADTEDQVAAVIPGAVPSETLEERYQHSMMTLAERFMAADNESPPPPPVLLPNHPWARTIIKWIVGGAFFLGVLYAGVTLAVRNNTAAIKDHDALPMHDVAAKELREMTADLAGVKRDVGEIKKAQTSISQGIEALKKERVEELKEELRLERRRNRRNVRSD
jgi:hypothetical protein